MSRWIKTSGVVSAISYPGYTDKPVVRVDIDTDDATYSLLFQSRRKLQAVDIGDQLAISGNLVWVDSIPVIYNPEYRILQKV